MTAVHLVVTLLWMSSPWVLMSLIVLACAAFEEWKRHLVEQELKIREHDLHL